MSTMIDNNEKNQKKSFGQRFYEFMHSNTDKKFCEHSFFQKSIFCKIYLKHVIIMLKFVRFPPKNSAKIFS